MTPDKMEVRARKIAFKYSGHDNGGPSFTETIIRFAKDYARELEAKLAHETRRADNLHGRRISELEAENASLRVALQLYHAHSTQSHLCMCRHIEVMNEALGMNTAKQALTETGGK